MFITDRLLQNTEMKKRAVPWRIGAVPTRPRLHSALCAPARGLIFGKPEEPRSVLSVGLGTLRCEHGSAIIFQPPRPMTLDETRKSAEDIRAVAVAAEP